MRPVVAVRRVLRPGAGPWHVTRVHVSPHAATGPGGTERNVTGQTVIRPSGTGSPPDRAGTGIRPQRGRTASTRGGVTATASAGGTATVSLPRTATVSATGAVRAAGTRRPGRIVRGLRPGSAATGGQQHVATASRPGTATVRAAGTRRPGRIVRRLRRGSAAIGRESHGESVTGRRGSAATGTRQHEETVSRPRRGSAPTGRPPPGETASTRDTGGIETTRRLTSKPRRSGCPRRVSAPAPGPRP